MTTKRIAQTALVGTGFLLVVLSRIIPSAALPLLFAGLCLIGIECVWLSVDYFRLKKTYYAVLMVFVGLVVIYMGVKLFFFPEFSLLDLFKGGSV